MVLTLFSTQNWLVASLGALVLSATAWIAFILIFYSWNVWTDARSLSALPWVGVRKESFSKVRACFRDWRNGYPVVTEGYYKFSKKGQFFVTPTWWSRAVVTVPPSEFQWYSKVLEEKTSLPQVIKNLQAQSVALPGLPKGETFYNQNIQYLKKLGPPELLSWTGPCFEAGLDTAHDWKTVDVMRDIIIATAGRLLVRVYYGEALSSNPDFVRHTLDYAVAFNCMDYRMTEFFPVALYPILYKFVAIYPLHFKRKYDKIVIPFIEKRLVEISANDGKTDELDLLSLYLQGACKSDEPMDRDAEVVAARFAMLIAAFSISTITGTLGVVIKKVAANDTYVETLERELKTATTSPGWKEWTAKTLNSLVHMDSFFRESWRYLRFNGFGLALMRVVTDPAGIRLPGDVPIVLPKGTWVGIPVDAINRDNDLFEDSEEFKPWRFVSADSEPHLMRNLMTALSDSNLAFGRGRHACPGRFFASDLIKTYFSYLITHYDIRLPPGPKPEGDFTHVQIRRKQKQVL